jgi:hypothetical protein
VRAALILLLLSIAAGTAAILALRPSESELEASDVAPVASGWVGVGRPQPPRREGNEWEVDVVRPDGSVVEVTVGNGRELLGFDEERGPGGGLAPDELTGAVRDRAVRSALGASGPGRALGAEWEPGGVIEVGVRLPGGTQLEVDLDHRLRVLEVEREDPADE